MSQGSEASDDGGLDERLRAVLLAAADGKNLPAEELERLLTEGCARAHELEMRCLQLDRRAQAIARGRGELDGLAAIRREQRLIVRHLVTLRSRLALLRTAARATAG
jgi:hypothetical protein